MQSLVLWATDAFTMSVAANSAVTGVGTQLQQVLTGGALQTVGLVTGGIAAMWLVFRLIRRAIHAH